MQKTKIEWCQMTYNPISGCRHNCPYCYARRIATRFGGYTNEEGQLVKPTEENQLHVLEAPLSITDRRGKSRKSAFPFGFAPTLHKYRLDEPQHVKEPKTVFVGSMCDLFGDYVPDEWIQSVFEACEAAPQHRYLFLTKNPARYGMMDLPAKDNFWFGWSVTEGHSRNCAKKYEHSAGPHFFVSVEPLLGPVELNGGFEWVIVGAMTGPGAEKHKPTEAAIQSVLTDAWEYDAPVYMKESMLPIVGEARMRREFPWETQKHGTRTRKKR